MKTLLIISYFYPPCNLTPSQRILSWAEHLAEWDIYPIIITRKWERHISSYYDCSIPTSDGIEVEMKETHEVHRLPYLGNCRDRMVQAYGKDQFTFFRKVLTTTELIGQNLSNRFIPYSNLYEYGKSICKEMKIDCIIVSGNPFVQFKFGYMLSKEFSIPWIADYRDAWTTSEITANERSRIFRFITTWDQYFEKQWVASASLITASSAPIARSISELTGVKGEPLYNGFVAEDFNSVANKDKYKDFTILYVGTLYNGQNVELFLTAFKSFIDKNRIQDARILFPGLALDEIQSDRIANCMNGYEDHYKTTTRIPREEILEMETRAHVLLYIGWQKAEGVVGSKIYEYLGSGTDVFVAPSDHGAVEQILKDAKWGNWGDTTDKIEDYLETKYNEFTSKNHSTKERNPDSVEQFSRKNQVRILSEHIMSCIK